MCGRRYGFRFGFEGLAEGCPHEPLELTPEAVNRIHEMGGSLLGSSRGPQRAAAMVDRLERLGIGILFAIGGDGTLRGAHAIGDEATRRGLKISVIGVPKTIDNDVSFVQRTFGFETAVSEARRATYAANAEAEAARNGIGLVKLMGRDSGFIAAYSAIVDGHANFCLIPEVPFTLERFLAELRLRLERRGHAVIVVAEGAGQDLMARKEERDASGNVKYGDIGTFLRDAIARHFDERQIPITLKYIDPSYAIRSVPTTAHDSAFCLLLGHNAVHAGMSGRTDMIVSFWNHQFTHVPIALAVSRAKENRPRRSAVEQRARLHSTTTKYVLNRPACPCERYDEPHQDRRDDRPRFANSERCWRSSSKPASTCFGSTSLTARTRNTAPPLPTSERSAARWSVTSQFCRICAVRRCDWTRSPAMSWSAGWMTSSRSSMAWRQRRASSACSYRALPNDLKPGETVLFADGTVAMIVTDVTPGRAHMKVTLPGRLRSRQGLNLPGSNLAVSALTDKDLHDLDWTARHADDVDFVGLSFTRSPEDVAALRRELQSRNCPARIVVKIEKPQAVQRLEEIIAVTDAVMVARGDLGVEMDVERVPAIQKRIIALCNQAHRPVITATQMLNSMEHSSRPTRAEASDVFNAVLDGTDAVMLSGESAVGEYPVEAVLMMRQICAEAEGYLNSEVRSAQGGLPPLSGLIDPITGASVDAACLMVQQLNAALIMVSTHTGRTALALSNRRPAATILALARDEHVARSLSLCWGVTPVVFPEPVPSERLLAQGMDWAKSHGLARSGQHAVLLGGRVADRSDVRAVLAGAIN